MSDAKQAPPSPATLADWCRRAAAGDAEALEHLLAAHHGRLLGFAHRKIDAEWRGRIEAEDLLQDAYVAAFAHITTFVYLDEDSFYRWVTRIIENHFVSRMRHWRRLKRDVTRQTALNPSDASRYDAFLGLVGGESPSLAARRDEAVGTLMGCMAQLPEDYRAVARRIHLMHESCEAVAAELGRSPEAVRRMASRSIEKLRECMGRASRFLSTRS